MTFENSVNNLHESKRYIESQFNIITTVVPSNGNFVIAEKSDKLLAVLGNDIDYREINVNEHKFIRVTVPDLNLAKKLFHINEIWGNKR
jgi:histidinol-phosphate/aromatic aminotransferase/cobyric acid decarboxylase-like protein